MQRYKALSGNAGVKAFAIGKDNIRIEFSDGTTYVYDHNCTGREHVSEMKRLALLGRGLTTYINRFVREKYAKKIG